MATSQRELKLSSILYLTTACQLRCKYCYEAEAREKLDKDIVITEEEIKEAIDFFVDNPNQGRSICLFGGEPLLAWDRLKYAVQYANDTPDFEYFSFNIITNGICLGDPSFYNEFWNFFDDCKNINLKLEISYDGIGQSERVFPDGSDSDKIVLSVIDKLNKDNKEFYLRYTLNTTTFLVIEKELIYFFEKYKNLAGITVNVAAENLDTLGRNYKEIVNEKKPLIEAIYSIYRKPICDFVCEYCRKCNFNDYNIHYIPTIGNKITSKEQGKFDRWNPLIGEEYNDLRYDINGNIV